MAVVEQRGDLFAAARVAGQNDVAARIALRTVDMILFFQLLHRICPPFDRFKFDK